jgi:hypothetical protein
VDRRWALLALPVLAVAVWYWSTYDGKTHNVEIRDEATSESYSPFDHWMLRRDMSSGYVRHFPDRIGPACLGEVYANEDTGALSTSALSASAAGEYASG